VPWTALADTEATLFARANNVSFDGTAWTQNISHGQMTRNGIDQTLTHRPARATCATCTRARLGAPPTPTTSCPAGSACRPRPTPPAKPLEEHSETETAHRKHSPGSRRGPGMADVPGVGRTDPV
jgi:hypothetical protein